MTPWIWIQCPREDFGDKGIIPAIIKEKPDVLFLYNDVMVTKSLDGADPRTVHATRKVCVSRYCLSLARRQYLQRLEAIQF
jgi:hypothetical protein